jgi:hypothetical protein
MDKTQKKAMEYLRYSKTQQSVTDRLMDQARRIRCDIANGHSPKCGLLECHPSCTKGKVK